VIGALTLAVHLSLYLVLREWMPLLAAIWARW
jgi:hypothetical protein